MATYKEWINIIDVDIDYYSAFIRAWIAFNSWYRSEYSDKQDATIIEKIKTSNNLFKNTIESFLDPTNVTEESNDFKYFLNNLRAALVVSSITTQERASIRKTISFSQIAIVNPKCFAEGDYRHSYYRVERVASAIKVLIAKKTNHNALLFNLEQDKYDFSQIEAHGDYQKLSIEQQGQLRAYYKEIDPYVEDNIITLKPNGQYEFVKDKNKVSRGIIEVLYLLRCSLMHGDVVPNKNTMMVYKYAYKIIALVLKRFV